MRLMPLVVVLTACTPAAVRAPGASRDAGPLALRDWRATNSVGTAGASLFGHVAATTPDTLLAIESPDAGRIDLHTTTAEGRMAPVGPLIAGPDRALILRDRGDHAMMSALARVLAPGDSLDVTLRFARAGAVTLRVPVVRLTEAATELP